MKRHTHESTKNNCYVVGQIASHCHSARQCFETRHRNALASCRPSRARRGSGPPRRSRAPSPGRSTRGSRPSRTAWRGGEGRGVSDSIGPSRCHSGSTGPARRRAVIGDPRATSPTVTTSTAARRGIRDAPEKPRPREDPRPTYCDPAIASTDRPIETYAFLTSRLLLRRTSSTGFFRTRNVHHATSMPIPHGMEVRVSKGCSAAMESDMRLDIT